MTDLRDLKEHVDVRMLLEADLGPPARKSGEAWQWSCVFHPDKRTPSLTAWRDGWRCFACAKSGDAIAWLTEYRGLTFKDAVRALGGDLPMPERRASAARRTAPKAPPLREPPSRAWREAAAQFVQEAHACLLSDVGAKARVWLAQRGITLEDVRLWRLGYIPADRKDRWGDVDVFLPRGVVIPGLVGGVPWYVKVRRPMDSPKYVHVKGSRPALFGVDLLQGRPDLLLCEGEFDCAVLHRLVGDVLDVATFGSASDKDIRLWFPELIRYRRILIGFDSDEAGAKAASAWLARTRRARLLPVPEGFKDWTDCWKAWGDSRLREYVLAAVAIMEGQD